jgi:hypothetical protein
MVPAGERASLFLAFQHGAGRARGAGRRGGVVASLAGRVEVNDRALAWARGVRARTTGSTWAVVIAVSNSSP